MEWTEEQQAKIDMVRLLIGISAGSPFYSFMTDDEIGQILIMENWNVKKAARRAAISMSFLISAYPYRERTGNIEVWNNASLQYLKVLQIFIDESGEFNLPDDLLPYAAGISRADVCAALNNKDRNRSPLVQITPCLAWWTELDGGDPCHTGGGCGCSSLTIIEE